MTRPVPDTTGDERTMLAGLLDFLRATIVAKAEGVSDDDARTAPVPTSTMTVMGLVKHLTAVERWWFSIDFAGRDVALPWPEGAPRDGFELEADDTMAKVIDRYLAEVDASREVVAGSAFDELAEKWGQRYPAVIRLWDNAWAAFIPFLDYGACRRIACRWPWVDWGRGRIAATGPCEHGYRRTVFAAD